MVSLLGAALAVSAVPSACNGLLVPPLPPPVARRSVRADDLVRLRDFGPLGSGGGERSFTVSPDGRSVALVLRRADPVSNSYCVAVVVIDRATGQARVIDAGGDLVRPTYAHSGILGDFPMGVPKTITPAWSPDGHWVAFLKQRNGRTQAWRARADGGGAERLTDEAQDVTAVAFSADGGKLLYATDRVMTEAQRAIDRESLSGWHYDDRFSPLTQPRPYPRPSPREQHVTLALASRAIRPASAAEDDRLAAQTDGRSLRDHSRTGAALSVTLEPAVPSAYWSWPVLVMRVGVLTRRCAAPACREIAGFWLAPDRRSVLLLARTGWGESDLTFYRWSIATGRLNRLATTSALLTSCVPQGSRLLCAWETATAPRRLALVDPVTGAARTVFNPNPDYDALRQSRVERLSLASDRATRTFADVVFPPDFVSTRRYPLVVVQYESRGFLRGGTGDEYPIPALAAAGMIVLSFQRPRDLAVIAAPPPVDADDFLRIDLKGWADRRNVQSALLDGVSQLVRRGIIDPTRIGITGFSDGVATAAFALASTRVFSVAAISQCCEEPVGIQTLQGPAFARRVTAAGYPPLTRPDPHFWAPYSLAQHASPQSVPLLIQASDRDYVAALETIGALHEVGAPYDLYVFPGEFHVKWHPAHRLAIYQRNLRWFQFWFGLPSASDDRTEVAGERARWQAMRDRRARP